MQSITKVELDELTILGVSGCSIYAEYYHAGKRLLYDGYYDEIDYQNMCWSGSYQIISLDDPAKNIIDREQIDPDYELHNAIMKKAIELFILDNGNVYMNKLKFTKEESNKITNKNITIEDDSAILNNKELIKLGKTYYAITQGDDYKVYNNLNKALKEFIN